MAKQYSNVMDKMLDCFVETIKNGEEQIKSGDRSELGVLFDPFTKIYFDELPYDQREKLTNSSFGAEVDQRKATFYEQYAEHLYDIGANESDILDAIQTSLSLFLSSTQKIKAFEARANNLEWVKIDEDGSILFDFDDCTIKTIDHLILKYSIHHNHGSALLTFENMEIHIDDINKDERLMMAVDELEQALNILNDLDIVIKKKRKLRCFVVSDSDEEDENILISSKINENRYRIPRTGFGFQCLQNNEEKIFDYNDVYDSVNKHYLVNKKCITFVELCEAYIESGEHDKATEKYQEGIAELTNDLNHDNLDSTEESECDNKWFELIEKALQWLKNYDLSIALQTHKTFYAFCRKHKIKCTLLPPPSNDNNFILSDSEEVFEQINIMRHSKKQRSNKKRNNNINRNNLTKKRKLESLSLDNSYDGHRHKRRRLNDDNYNKNNRNIKNKDETDCDYSDDFNDDEYIKDYDVDIEDAIGNLDKLIEEQKTMQNPSSLHIINKKIRYKTEIADIKMQKANFIQYNLPQTKKNSEIIKELNLNAVSYLMGIKDEISSLKQRNIIKKCNNNIPPPLLNSNLNYNKDLTSLMDAYFASLDRVGKYWMIKKDWNLAIEKFGDWLENEVVDYKMVDPKILLKWQYYMTSHQAFSFKNLENLSLATKKYQESLLILNRLSKFKDMNNIDFVHIVIDVDKQKSYIYLELGHVYHQLDRNKEALEFYDKAAKISDDAEYKLDAVFNLAKTMREMGDYDQALGLLQYDCTEAVQHCIDNYPKILKYRKTQCQIKKEIKEIKSHQTSQVSQR